MNEMPQTTAVCDETGEEFSLLNPHLEVSVRVVKQVVQVDPLGVTPEADEDADPDDMEAGDPEIYLATRAGRGVTKRFKDWPAFNAWVEHRQDYEPKLQFHHEPEFVPVEGNATDEDDEDGE